MSMTAGERERFEQDVRAIVASEMRRWCDMHVREFGPSDTSTIMRIAFPEPAKAPPAVSGEQAVSRVAVAIQEAMKYGTYHDAARAALAAIAVGEGKA